MWHRYCYLARSFMLIILLLGWGSSAMAFTMRFAPLDPTPGDVDVYAPSTSVPVAPQFFRLTVVRQQAIIGAEVPYVRVVEPVSPVRFNVKKLSRAKPAPISHTPLSPPRHQLRGPETFLLRRTQTVADR